MKLAAAIIKLLLGSSLLLGQAFTIEGTELELDSMTREIDKINFVIDNFYKIYSADLDNAIELTNTAINLSQKNKIKEKEGYARMFNGVAYYLRGNYERSLESYLIASTIFDSLEHNNGIARLNNEMAIFYRKQGDLEKAYQSLDKAEKAALEANNKEELGTNYGHRGAFLSAKNKHEEARPYFLKTLGIRQELNDSVGLGYVYLDLAQYELFKGDFEKSLAYIDQSTVIRTKIGDSQGVAVNTVTIGENYYSIQNYLKAIIYFKKTIILASEIGLSDILKFSYYMLQKSYLTIGDFEEAYYSLQKKKVLDDSLFNVRKTIVIADMQAKYDTDKKDQEIVYLNQENELKTASLERNTFLISSLIMLMVLMILFFYFVRYNAKQKHKDVLQEQKIRMRETQMQAVIDSQEQERKRFATDLHDGMGQLVSALQLNIQAMNEMNGDLSKRDELYENSTDLLKDVHNEIRNIAFGLMPQTLVKEGLTPAFRELINRINKTDKVIIQLSLTGMERRLPEVIEVCLYRITQEFFSNIIKYSQAKHIYLSLTRHDDELVLTIDDDGVGYDLDAFKNSEGNGWRNINSRLNLVKGRLDIDTNKERKGSVIMIVIPSSVLEESVDNSIKV